MSWPEVPWGTLHQAATERGFYDEAIVWWSYEGEYEGKAIVSWAIIDLTSRRLIDPAANDPGPGSLVA